MRKHTIFCYPTLLVVMFFVLLISACTKSEKQPSCANGIKDGSETEIDCGGGCMACPSAVSISADFSGITYHATNVSSASSNSPIETDITTLGAGTTHMGFSFWGTEMNTPLTLISGGFSDGVNSYSMNSSDTGSVVLTSFDSVRNIYSGHFSFSASYFSSPKAYLTNGQFTNFRRP